MTLHMLAPAKVNLGLEVIRRRPDGYHDIATVFQTISVFDRIRMSPSDVDEVEVINQSFQFEANLAGRALETGRRAGLTSQHWRVEITKRIPVAAGLGGASADAAAVLAGLALQSQRVPTALTEPALSLGSDVPFFMQGGAAIAGGRGELLSSIAPLSDCWFVLASPRIELEQKTAQLYRSLSATDFTNGSRAKRVATSLEAGEIPASADLANAFARPLYTLLPELNDLQRDFLSAGAPFVGLTGAGPTHYAVVTELATALALAWALRRITSVASRVLIARPTGTGPILAEKTHRSAGAL